MGLATRAVVSFECGFWRGQAGEAQTDLAISTCGQNGIRKWRVETVGTRIGEQIDLNCMCLKLGGERLPAGSVIADKRAGVCIQSGEGDKEMSHVRAGSAGGGCGAGCSADFHANDSVGGA